tara:strand:+ start:903 stop:1124 length:222 start_codon:yes stop_codon:yes gene_type:complete
MNNVENAWIPPESEKKSTKRPNIKLKKRKENLFFFKGYKKTNDIYRYGLICPKKLMLFRTKTCRKSKNKKNKI